MLRPQRRDRRRATLYSPRGRGVLPTGPPNPHPSCHVTGLPTKTQTSNQGEDCPTVLDTYGVKESPCLPWDFPVQSSRGRGGNPRAASPGSAGPARGDGHALRRHGGTRFAGRGAAPHSVWSGVPVRAQCPTGVQQNASDPWSGSSESTGAPVGGTGTPPKNVKSRAVKAPPLESLKGRREAPIVDGCSHRGHVSNGQATTGTASDLVAPLEA